MNDLHAALIMAAQLTIILILLFLADRWLHRHLQGVMLLLAGDPEIALWLYAIILFPGVVLHELSHALVAGLLGVNIGRINVLPRRVGKRIQLGFVPVEETDFIRASLIGAAPLFVGGAVVVALGHFVFGTPDLVAALTARNWRAALNGLYAAVQAPDAWFWAYLTFTIGNTMLPSRSDVHAWPVLGIVTGIVIALVLLAGGGALILDGFVQALLTTGGWIILLGGSTLLLDVPFFFGVFLTEKILEETKGVRVDYR